MIIIDWFSFLIIFIFSLFGFFKGFANELFSVAAWLISIVVALYFGPLVFPYLSPYFTNPEIMSISSFLILFFIFFLTIKFSGFLVSKFVTFIGLGSFDKSFGLIFGALKAVAILVTLYMLAFNSLETQAWWSDSLSREWTIKTAEIMEPLIKDWKHQADILLNKENVTFPPSL